MCGCENHHDGNAPCTCMCPSHSGVRAEMEATAKAARTVTIDVEDREQVERLTAAYQAAHYSGPLPEQPMNNAQLKMRAALRSLLAPPKPPEPLGLGAVVVDAGDEYVHFGNGCWIKAVPNAGMYQRGWTDMTAAVKILNPGVTS